MKLLTQRIQRDKNLRDLLRNSGLVYVAGAVSIALTFAQQVSTANALGLDDYGRFAAVVGTSLLFMLIADFRTWEISAKLLARSFADGDNHESASIITWLSLADFISGLVMALGLMLFADWIALTMLDAPHLSGWFQVYALFTPIRLYARGVPNTVIRLYGRFDWLSAKSVSYALVRLVLISGAALLGWGLDGVILGAIISDIFNAALMHGMTLALWRRHTQQRTFIRWARPERMHDGLRLMRDLWIGGTLKGLQLETFIPILALLTDSAQVGLYRISLDIAQLIARLTEPLVVILQASLIQVYEQQPLAQFMRYIRQVGVISAVLVLPPLIIFVIFATPFLPSVLGHEYADITPIVNILAIGIALDSATPWLRPAIIAMNAITRQNILDLWAFLGIIVGLLWLGPLYGAQGAAVVMSVFLVTYTIARGLLFMRLVRLHQHAII